MSKHATLLSKTYLILIVFTILGIYPVGCLYAVDIPAIRWSPRSDWINVKADSHVCPHAVGDGVTDDTAALQSAFTFLSQHPYGFTVYIPAGTYKVSQKLTIGALGSYVPNSAIVGCGADTVIKWAGLSGSAILQTIECTNLNINGLVFNGGGTGGAACGLELYSPGKSNSYENGYRLENLSFANFTQTGNYMGTGYGSIPAAGIAANFQASGVPSIQADSTLTNCRFSNCNIGFLVDKDIVQNLEWLIDQCEFDTCNYGLVFGIAGGGNGACCIVQNCHFQQSSVADITGGGNIRFHHCTSFGSGSFYNGQANASVSSEGTDGAGGNDVFQDCWVDSWTSTSPLFQVNSSIINEEIFDCSFTNPPADSKGIYRVNGTNYPQVNLLLSNNYAAGFPKGYGLVAPNPFGPTFYSIIPPGLRFSSLTSPTQTFLNSTPMTDSTHIIDVSQPPYNSDSQGVTDCTTAIQSAITTAQNANNGSIVYFPRGKYLISNTLTASGSNFSIQSGRFQAQFFWGRGAPNNIPMFSLVNPSNVTVRGLFLNPFYPVSTPNSVTGISVSGSSPCNITIDEITMYAGAQSGLLLSNLPAGSKVYVDELNAPLTVQNCGAAQIYVRWLTQLATNSGIKVSGLTPSTGFLGVGAQDGGQGIPGNFDLSITDNQSFVEGDYYSEETQGNFQLQRGTGTGYGAVTIEGFGSNTSSGQTLLSIDNYEGRVTLNAGNFAENYGHNPLITSFSGKNPVDINLVTTGFSSGAPTFALVGADHLIQTMNVANESAFPPTYLDNSPSPMPSKGALSIALGLDPLRQLEAVGLSVEEGISTDPPPIAAYAFEGDSSDECNTFNGKPSNVSFVDGEVGNQAAFFNGLNSCIQIPSPIASDFSISMWLQTRDTGGTGQWYSGKGLVDGYMAAKTSDFGTALNNGKFSLGIGGPNTTLTSTRSVNDGYWHFVVATRDCSTGAMQVYVDGDLDATKRGPTATKGAADKLMIGSIGDRSSAGFFKGALDQVQIYNYVLSANDVTQLFTHSGSFPPVAAYWKLDEKTGNISADATGHGTVGTWHHAPLFTPDHPDNNRNTSNPGCLRFNGQNQFISMGPAPCLPSGFAPRTLSAWAKGGGQNGYGMIASFGTPSNGNGMWIGANGNSLSAGSWGYDLPDVPNFWDGNWHFICLTYDGQTAVLYADGAALESASEPAWNLKPSVCYIGCYLNNSSFWNGKVDDVRIYNRALSAADVANMTTINTYDLSANFNLSSDSTSNVWAYGTYSSLTSPSTFNIPTTITFSNSSGLAMWNFPPPGMQTDPNVEKNTTASPIFGAQIEWLPGTVSYGPYQGPSVSRFTAPRSGHYNISASFQTDQIRGNTGDGTTAYVYVGSTNAFTQVLSDPGIAQFGTPASYSAANVPLTAGETIDFVVGNGAFTTQVGATLNWIGP